MIVVVDNRLDADAQTPKSSLTTKLIAALPQASLLVTEYRAKAMPSSWAKVKLVILSGSGLCLSEPRATPFFRTPKRSWALRRPTACHASGSVSGCRPWRACWARPFTAGTARPATGESARGWTRPCTSTTRMVLSHTGAWAKAKRYIPTGTSCRFGMAIGRGCSGTRKGQSREPSGCGYSYPKNMYIGLIYFLLFYYTTTSSLPTLLSWPKPTLEYWRKDISPWSHIRLPRKLP